VFLPNSSFLWGFRLTCGCPPLLPWRSVASLDLPFLHPSFFRGDHVFFQMSRAKKSCSFFSWLSRDFLVGPPDHRRERAFFGNRRPFHCLCDSRRYLPPDSVLKMEVLFKFMDERYELPPFPSYSLPPDLKDLDHSVLSSPPLFSWILMSVRAIVLLFSHMKSERPSPPPSSKRID